MAACIWGVWNRADLEKQWKKGGTKLWRKDLRLSTFQLGKRES